MLGALRLMMFKSLRGSHPSDKTLYPVNSFHREELLFKVYLVSTSSILQITTFKTEETQYKQKRRF